MTQPHHMSRPTEDRMARFDALLDELSSERDVVKASAWRPEPGSSSPRGRSQLSLYSHSMVPGGLLVMSSTTRLT